MIQAIPMNCCATASFGWMVKLQTPLLKLPSRNCCISKAEQPLEPIHLLIKSAGGCVAAGMAIVDTLRTIRSPVRTRSAEEAQGMVPYRSRQRAARRAGRPRVDNIVDRAKFEADAGSQADISGIRSQLANEFAKLSALSSEEIAKQLVTGKYMAPAEAVMFGFVDRIEAYASCALLVSASRPTHSGDEPVNHIRRETRERREFSGAWLADCGDGRNREGRCNDAESTTVAVNRCRSTPKRKKPAELSGRRGALTRGYPEFRELE